MNIEYTVLRSSRKTLAVQVKADGSVIVRCPFGTTESAVHDAVERHKEWIINAINTVGKRREKYPEPTREEENELIKRAKEALPEKVRRYAEIMGVTPTKISVTRAKTRFGSCSGKNAISFSCRLMMYPDEFVDYVVVHELAHIKQHNHSAAFWREVEKVLPDWKTRKKNALGR